MSNRRCIFVVLATLAIFMVAQSAWASDVWTFGSANSNWSDSLNWAGSTVPNLDGDTADFSYDIVTAGVDDFVDVDAGVDPLTIGHLIFDDTGTAGDTSWIVNDTTTTAVGFTLADTTGTASRPSITTTVNATINSKLIGTQGFDKLGGAQLILTADNSTPTLTGDINISAGTVVFGSGTNLGAVDGGGVPTNVLRMTGGGGVRYTGTADQTLNTIDQASFNGNLESTAGRLVIDQDLVSTSIGTLRAGGPGGGTLQLAAGRTFTMPGNVSFDGDWGAGGVPGINVEILGNLNSGGYASGLYIGTAVTASGTAAIVHRDG
ncbi:MAG TPA: hypothetical protein VIH42_11610, partial [Thermoguttaceae bacterium]